MSGRPINEDRQNAIALGLKTYIGAKHVNCDTTERYVKGGGCVHCARIIATEQREARNYLKRQAGNIDGRGDQGGGYPSSQGPLDIPAEDGLEIDETEDDRKARFEESIEDLM